ncbi:hypothetical protein LCGC14_0426780 [marine sediment metagenome]|uniref:Uncharacterized protein n=1 Tax=marine sediment metagenome TaxID=412755 RepID=A0A0F9VYU0_9ZZZZ
MCDVEQKVMDALVVAWNNFVKLRSTHPDDTDDFRRGIHECQRIMGVRQLRRIDPDRWPMYKRGNI